MKMSILYLLLLSCLHTVTATAEVSRDSVPQIAAEYIGERKSF